MCLQLWHVATQPLLALSSLLPCTRGTLEPTSLPFATAHRSSSCTWAVWPLSLAEQGARSGGLGLLCHVLPSAGPITVSGEPTAEAQVGPASSCPLRPSVRPFPPGSAQELEESLAFRGTYGARSKVGTPALPVYTKIIYNNYIINIQCWAHNFRQALCPRNKP
jgi:hypothetical protein